MGTVQRLRPIRVLLASRDPGFVGVTGLLLSRVGFVVETTRTMGRLLDLVDRQRTNVLLLDGSDSLPSATRIAAAIRTSRPQVGVVLAAEEDGLPVFRGFELLPKWSPLDEVVARVERAYARLGPRENVAAHVQLPAHIDMHFHERLPLEFPRQAEARLAPTNPA